MRSHLVVAPPSTSFCPLVPRALRRRAVIPVECLPRGPCLSVCLSVCLCPPLRTDLRRTFPSSSSCGSVIIAVLVAAPCYATIAQPAVTRPIQGTPPRVVRRNSIEIPWQASARRRLPVCPSLSCSPPIPQGPANTTHTGSSSPLINSTRVFPHSASARRRPHPAPRSRIRSHPRPFGHSKRRQLRVVPEHQRQDVRARYLHQVRAHDRNRRRRSKPMDCPRPLRLDKHQATAESLPSPSFDVPSLVINLDLGSVYMSVSTFPHP